MSPPSHLYKYEDLAGQSLRNLKGQVLYFGSPLGFNDPYDCALIPNIRVPSDGEVEEIRQTYLNDPETPQVAGEEFLTSDVEKLRQTFIKSAKDAIEIEIKRFLANRGVACFSERNDDLLMWSHYGGRYRGICLEFSTSSEALENVKKVEYLDAPPKIDVYPLLVDRDFDVVPKLFCTKSSHWGYEKEWRAIHGTVGTEFVYRAEDLTGVYFGPEMDRQSMEIVCLVLGGQNEGVKLWQGHRSSTEFRVSFQEFNYISFLEAKRSGLSESGK